MRYGCSMAVLLLECREDEERQANFLSKEASSPVLETTPVLPMLPFLMEI